MTRSTAIQIGAVVALAAGLSIAAGVRQARQAGRLQVLPTAPVADRARVVELQLGQRHVPARDGGQPELAARATAGLGARGDAVPALHALPWDADRHPVGPGVGRRRESPAGRDPGGGPGVPRRAGAGDGREPSRDLVRRRGGGRGGCAATAPGGRRGAGVFGFDRATRPADITDGPGTTMMVVETARVEGGLDARGARHRPGGWTRPRGPTWAGIARSGGNHPGGVDGPARRRLGPGSSRTRSPPPSSRPSRRSPAARPSARIGEKPAEVIEIAGLPALGRGECNRTTARTSARRAFAPR